MVNSINNKRLQARRQTVHVSIKASESFFIFCSVAINICREETRAKREKIHQIRLMDVGLQPLLKVVYLLNFTRGVKILYIFPERISILFIFHVGP